MGPTTSKGSTSDYQSNAAFLASKESSKAGQKTNPREVGLSLCTERTFSNYNHSYFSSDIIRKSGILKYNFFFSHQIAAKLCEKLGSIDCLEKTEISGPGFLNFYLKPKYVLLPRVSSLCKTFTSRYYQVLVFIFVWLTETRERNINYGKGSQRNVALTSIPSDSCVARSGTWSWTVSSPRPVQNVSGYSWTSPRQTSPRKCTLDILG